jgi:hypothetical protein
MKKNIFIEILASISSIIGLLYAIGFLAERSFFRTLGLFDIPINNQIYIEAGGYFFWKSALSLPLIPIILIEFTFRYWWLFVPILVLFGIVYILKGQKRLFIANGIKSIKVKKPIIVSYILILLFCLIILWTLFFSFSFFIKPTTVNNLLTEGNNWLGQNNHITQMIVSNTEESNARLAMYYAKLELTLITLIVFIVITNQVIRRYNIILKFGTLTKLLKIILSVLALLLLLILPLDYGVLITPKIFLRVQIEYTDSRMKTADCLLIGHDNNDITFYTLNEKKVIIINKNVIKTMTITGESSPFSQ